MSKKKHKDKAQPQAASEAKAEAAPKPVTFTYEMSADLRPFQRSWLSQIMSSSYFTTTTSTTPKVDLRAAVADQVEALTADFDGDGGEELPAPPKDLTTYRDAWASAAAKCDHQDAIEIMYGREWLCESCHRMLNREDMRKAGWSRWG